jgi:hypothetical protein
MRIEYNSGSTGQNERVTEAKAKRLSAILQEAANFYADISPALLEDLNLTVRREILVLIEEIDRRVLNDGR